MNRLLLSRQGFFASNPQVKTGDDLPPSRFREGFGQVLNRGRSLFSGTARAELEKKTIAPSFDQVARLVIVSLAVFCIIAAAKF